MMNANPLTEPQIQAAIRALDAGDRPARATLRTALLMALAWHAAQAEIAGRRGRIAALESTVRNLQVWAKRIVMCPQCGHTELEYPGAGIIWCPACQWENDPMAQG